MHQVNMIFGATNLKILGILNCKVFELVWQHVEFQSFTTEHDIVKSQLYIVQYDPNFTYLMGVWVSKHLCISIRSQLLWHLVKIGNIEWVMVIIQSRWNLKCWFHPWCTPMWHLISIYISIYRALKCLWFVVLQGPFNHCFQLHSSCFYFRAL